MMETAQMRERFRPVFDDLVQRASVTGKLLHRDLYRILVASLWAQVVMKPAAAGLAEADLEALHDLLNDELRRLLGPKTNLTECFAFLNTKAGAEAMQEARLTPDHRDLLLYFCSMILDPDGHADWARHIRQGDKAPAS